MNESNREFAPHDDEPFKAMPHNLEAEQSLLGAMLINNDAFYVVSDFLLSEHFYEQIHQNIFYVISQVLADGKTATPISIKGYLQPDQMIGELTVAAYLIRLATQAATVFNAKNYGQVIKESYQRRLGITIAEELAGEMMEADVDKPPREIIDGAITSLHEAISGKEIEGLKTVYQLAGDSITKTNDAYSGEKLIGFSTGLADLDSMVDCLEPGHLVPLFGRSGTFKTALATQIGMSVAKQGGNVLMIQLEMKGYEVARRVLSSVSGISAQRQRRGKINPADFEKLVRSKEEIKGLNFWIHNPGSMTWAQMRVFIERVQRLHGVDMVIIDHQRRVKSEARMDPIATIENFFNGMMDMKQEHDILFMPLVQLKTDDMRFAVERPKVNNAYGGDIINNSADMILAAHNEFRILKKSPPDKSSSKYLDWQAKCDEWEGKMEIGCLKYRDGEELPYRTFNVDGPRMLFSDITKQEAAGDPMGLF